jgi:hypothetical protein
LTKIFPARAAVETVFDPYQHCRIFHVIVKERKVTVVFSLKRQFNIAVNKFFTYNDIKAEENGTLIVVSLPSAK